MRALKPFVLLENSPWATSLLAAAGVALGVPSAFLLLLPPDLLDAVWTLGDRRLTSLLLFLFAATAAIVRIALRRPAIEEEPEPAPHGAPPVASGHLR